LKAPRIVGEVADLASYSRVLAHPVAPLKFVDEPAIDVKHDFDVFVESPSAILLDAGEGAPRN
jgi:hypothetical protein